MHARLSKNNQFDYTFCTHDAPTHKNHMHTSGGLQSKYNGTTKFAKYVDSIDAIVVVVAG